jgi:hypothetical protein
MEKKVLTKKICMKMNVVLTRQKKKPKRGNLVSWLCRKGFRWLGGCGIKNWPQHHNTMKEMCHQSKSVFNLPGLHKTQSPKYSIDRSRERELSYILTVLLLRMYR